MARVRTTADAKYTFIQDRTGAMWDAALYVPTVSALLLIAASTWYSGQSAVTYLLVFLACFFLFAGANRVLSTRLMLLPAAPVAIETMERGLRIVLRNGTSVVLHDIKLFRDRAGKSFGVTGISDKGAQAQYVFHRGQFADPAQFTAVMDRYSPRAGS